MTTPTLPPPTQAPPGAYGTYVPPQGPPPGLHYAPPSFPQPKKPFYKRTWFIVSIAVFLALVAGSAIGTAAQQKEAVKAAVPAATVPVQPPAAATPAPEPTTPPPAAVAPTPTPAPSTPAPATKTDAQLVQSWFSAGGLTAMNNLASVLGGPLDVTSPAFGRQLASKARAVNAVSAPLPPSIGTPLHAAMTHYANAGDAIAAGNFTVAAAQLEAGNTDMDTANAALDAVQNSSTVY